jgi:MscS family membrane protein
MKPSFLKSCFESILAPALFLVIAFLALFALQYLGWNLHFQHDILRAILIVIAITWFLLRWKSAYIHQLNIPKKERAFVKGVSFFITLCIFAIGALIILDLLQIPIAALLTFGGIGGIAISFAAKDVLSNLFGTIMLYTNGHITEGDFIRSTTKNFEGVVEHIGWFQTRMRSVEKTVVYVPNSILTETIIENEGKRSHRRLVIKIPLRYLDRFKIDELTVKIESYLKKHPQVDDKQDISIAFTSYGRYALELTLYAYLKEINFVLFNKEQQKILLKIHELIREAGAELSKETDFDIKITQP